MPDTKIPCCLIIDDTPLNASYYWRLQQTAFGFKPTPDIWGDLWKNQAGSALIPLSLFEQFADLVQEYGVRGKFSMVPCPAALGRLDTSIRGMSDNDLHRIIETVRTRIAPQFTITPETLTHTMGYDMTTGGLRPHSETAWTSYLAKENRIDDLAEYVSFGYQILRNIGLEPHGCTFGGMTDPSGIAGGEMIVHGHHKPRVLDALTRVERQHYGDAVKMTFCGGGGDERKPAKPPELMFTSPEGIKGYTIFSHREELLAELYNGEGDVEPVVDYVITEDGKGGIFTEYVKNNGVFAFGVHGQTMHCRGTFKGLKALRMMIERIHKHYGARIEWRNSLEMCELAQQQAG